MKLKENDLQVLEELVYDKEFDINFFSIEFSNGERLEISR